MFFNFLASFIIGQFFNTMLCRLQVQSANHTHAFAVKEWPVAILFSTSRSGADCGLHEVCQLLPGVCLSF